MEKCKIVRDLFPSYIDGLTNEYTNKYIEEHINECEECKEELESMKKELESNHIQKNSKEVKYIKKFSNKLKILKTVLLVILLIFMFSVGRKMIIIASLNNKISNYTSSTNYYMKAYNYSDEDFIISEYYKKDDKYVKKLKFFTETESGQAVVTSIDYYNGKTVNSYNEASKKIAILNRTNNIMQVTIPNKLEIYNPFYYILISAISSIKTEECKGIECYRIVILNGGIYYIDKETGLVIRTIGESKTSTDSGNMADVVTDFQYEFDVVTDDDFIEPDISEYEIQE